MYGTERNAQKKGIVTALGHWSRIAAERFAAPATADLS
jgi:hypothetical protein